MEARAASRVVFECSRADGCGRVRGVVPAVYHCLVVEDVSSSPQRHRIDVLTVEPCFMEANDPDALRLDPRPCAVSRAVAAHPQVQLVAFGMGTEPLHLVAHAIRPSDGRSYIVGSATVAPRPVAGQLIPLTEDGRLALRVLRVEWPQPPCDLIALHDLARATGALSIDEPVKRTEEQEQEPEDVLDVAPIPCLVYHADSAITITDCPHPRALLGTEETLFNDWVASINGGRGGGMGSASAVVRALELAARVAAPLCDGVLLDERVPPTRVPLSCASLEGHHRVVTSRVLLAHAGCRASVFAADAKAREDSTDQCRYFVVIEQDRQPVALVDSLAPSKCPVFVRQTRPPPCLLRTTAAAGVYALLVHSYRASFGTPTRPSAK